MKAETDSESRRHALRAKKRLKAETKIEKQTTCTLSGKAVER